MQQSRARQAAPPKGMHVLDIPLDQLIFDPHQPRKIFTTELIAELAETIKSQGLQQLPVVNFAYERDGKRYYYIKAGERRFRAHLLLRRETMPCLVETAAYDGTRSVERILAQAAENSSREPHTHAEIVAVMDEVVQEEKAKRGEHHHGAIEVAMGRVAQAFGKSRAWAEQYYALTHLHPELREMLDDPNDEERLNFNAAIALSRIPANQQHELLEQGKKMKAKGGHALMYRFIVLQARALREHRGIMPRGRKPSDDKAIIVTAVDRLYRHAVNFCAERRSSEHKRYLIDVLGQMSILEIDNLLHQLGESLIAFQGLKDLAQVRRDALYQAQGLRVVTRR